MVESRGISPVGTDFSGICKCSLELEKGGPLKAGCCGVWRAVPCGWKSQVSGGGCLATLLLRLVLQTCLVGASKVGSERKSSARRRGRSTTLPPS